MKQSIRMKMGLLFVPACLLATSTAFAVVEECAADADCAEGQVCEKGMFVDGCAPDADGGTDHCNTEPQVAETGYCVTPPTPCAADADCDEYLSCVSSESGACSVDSDGDVACSEPDPAAPKYCSVASIACATSDDCPREFECIERSVCPAIACAEGDEECLDACAPSGHLECQPKQIPCEATSDCPSAWSCVGNYIETCSGDANGGSEDGGGEDGGGSQGSTDPGKAVDLPAESGAEPADADGTPPDQVTCTSEPTVGKCQPDAWSGSFVATDTDLPGSGPGGDADQGDPNTVSGEPESAQAGGGCSVASRRPGGGASWALGLLLGLPLLRRRRGAA